jgi:hypothetical protein
LSPTDGSSSAEGLRHRAPPLPAHGYELRQRLARALGPAGGALTPGQVYMTVSRRELPRELRRVQELALAEPPASDGALLLEGASLRRRPTSAGWSRASGAGRCRR